MQVRKILTVGFELASPDTTYASFRSKMSLLDWDIVLFEPDISDFLHNHYETYLGKPCLNDTASFEAQECCAHWRREIKQAVEAGKTVLVFLPSLYEVYAYTGERNASGTGRNQKVTRIVSPLTNYHAIPFSVQPVVATGSSMKLAPKGAEVLGPYWNEFGTRSTYQVVLAAADIPACIITRTGDKAVGAIYRSKGSSGTLLLLPHIEFYEEGFLRGVSQTWTAAAKQFAGKFVATIVALDKALRSSSEVTPEPAWATIDAFALGPEVALRAQLLKVERELERAQKRKEETAESLASAGALRALLYEKGKPLEVAIIEALRVLGFKAAPFKESDSEFDVVFESEEGRLIGEAEGKDSKAVNIDKLRQLAMNIHEDHLREEVKTQAKPVLFGNGYRLQELRERPDPFTEKCYSAASTSSTALVFTPDLFIAVRYLVSNADLHYAFLCRQVILSTVGRVVFPLPPIVNQLGMEDKAEKTK